MFLFSTFIIQICLTTLSDFDAAVGMMMVENVPFYHTIAEIAISEQGQGKATFATIFVALAIGSVLVGVSFLALGYLHLGGAVNFIPRHCIIGCIGGIGIFIFVTGLEVSTDASLSLATVGQYFSHEKVYLWLVPIALELLLRLILHLRPMPLLPPFYFVSIPPLFYLVLFLFGVPLQAAHDFGWFFRRVSPSTVRHLYEVLPNDLV
jgi:SulP family sulfate permease